MDIDNRLDHACDSASPAVVPERLRSALDLIAEADHCLDFSGAAWRPVGADQWEQARHFLAQARMAVEGALAPWNSAGSA